MRAWSTWAAASVLAVLLAPAVRADGGDCEDDVVVVRIAPGVSINAICIDYDTEVERSIASRRLYLLDIPDEMDEEDFADLLALDPRIEISNANYFARDPGPGTQSFYLSIAPPGFTNQYPINVIALPPAHTLSSGAGVVVAVLDNGVDAQHAFLAPRVLPGGYNFVDDNGNVGDVPDGIDNDGDSLIDEMVGHGTFVSGLIGLSAPGARLLPVKVMDSDGVATSFRVAQGIDFAIEHGARLLNLSLGAAGSNLILDEALGWADDAGVTVIAAAGNDGASSPAWSPSSHPMAVAVAATDASDIKASFSNYGGHVDLSAPGVGVASTLPGNVYGMADGTSYSAPLVAGVAALVLQREPLLSHTALVARLKSTARPLDPLNPNYAGMLGAGRVDAAAALAEGCYADCNADGALTIADFGCFQTRFVSGMPYTDCNGDGQRTVADFGCFQTGFVQGCP